MPATAPAPPARGRRPDFTPLWLLTPAGLVIFLVTLAPIAYLVYTSFTDYSQKTLFTGEFQYTGLQQYTDLFGDSEFWKSLVRTIVFTAAMVAGSMVIGMGISHLLTKVTRGWRLVTTIVLIMAWAMPNVASSLVWNWLFQPGYGVVNWGLDKLQIFGDTTDLNWAGDAPHAYAAIWMLVVWQAVPFIALTLNAAEQQVPIEYQEAARLDGASEFTVYRIITLNALRPTLLLITILSVIWDYNVFNQIWLISNGGPDNATATLGVFTYKTAFIGFHIGRGAAISVVTTLLLLGLTALYIRNLLKSGEEL
jgi:N,N'-diacetylchitobiose transport system permease protein